jgi:ribosome-binding protein aMBF1 (putative translation factor)
MKKATKKKLERRGWKVGGAADFLELSPEEEALVEVKLELAEALRKRRQKSELTQAELAKRIGSSQSRVAKMEAGDPSVAIDLVVRALLAIGVRPKRIAAALT